MNIDEKVKKLPTTSGVYLMKNKAGKVIYVGKAISLRKRVQSYFRKSKGSLTKTDLLDQAEVENIAGQVVNELNWTAPWFVISSVARQGTDELVQSVGRALDEMKELEQEQQKDWGLETVSDT